MERPHLGAAGVRQRLAEIQNLIVQCSRLIIFVQWVDCGDKYWILRYVSRFHQPKWRGARSNQVPVCVCQERARDRRMMVGVLQDNIGADSRRMPNDPFVKGVIPYRSRLQNEA